MHSHSKVTHWHTFKHGIIQGFGWTIGATIGFAVISTLAVLLINILGGLPLIGHWVADIVVATNASLINRTPILR